MEAENLRLKKTNTALRQALASLQKSAEEDVGAVASRGGGCGVGRVWNGRRCVPRLLEEQVAYDAGRVVKRPSNKRCPCGNCGARGCCRCAEEDVAERGAGHYWRERTQGFSHATYTGNERPRGPKMEEAVSYQEDYDKYDDYGGQEEGVGFFGTHKCLARNNCIAECKEDDPSKSRYSCMKECPKSLCDKEYDSHDHDHDGVVDHDSEDHNSDSEENIGRSSRDSCLRGCQRLGAKDYAACEMRCRLETEKQVAYSAGRVTQTGSNKRCPCGNCGGRCCRCFAEQESAVGGADGTGQWNSHRPYGGPGDIFCGTEWCGKYTDCAAARTELKVDKDVGDLSGCPSGFVTYKAKACEKTNFWGTSQYLRECQEEGLAEKAVGGSWQNGKCMYYGSYLTDMGASVNDMGTGWSESSCQSECDASSTTKACQYEFSSQKCLMIGFYTNEIYGAGDYDALCYVK